MKFWYFGLFLIKNREFYENFKVEKTKILMFSHEHKNRPKNRSKHYFDTWGHWFERLDIIEQNECICSKLYKY